MKILVSHSFYLSLDPKESKNRKPYPPLASITLVAWLRKELGLEVSFYDVMFDKTPDGLIMVIRDMQPDIFILYDDDFNFLTKMCLENMRNMVFRVLRKAPKTGLFIAHGSDASDQAEMYLNAGFDLVAHHNAEKTILDITVQYREKLSKAVFLNQPGISMIDSGKVVKTSPANINVPIEETPLPAWDTLDLSHYREMWASAQGYFSLNVSTSHGCPFRCNWCAKPLYGRSYKALSPRRAAEEFAFLAREIRADHVWVTDDIFALKPGWISEFADILTEMQVKIPYKCQNRADLITEKMAVELARSGCSEVWIGVESGSQRILDAMEKGESLDSIKNACVYLRQNGIQVGFFLQYGYLGEEYSDIRQTLALVKECLPDHIGISVSYPLKGTPFYEMVVSQLGEKKNWSDSGDLALMYRGAYHPDFYRALHSYTHHYFGFVSLFRSQPFRKWLRRGLAQIKHIPGMLKYKRIMKAYL